MARPRLALCVLAVASAFACHSAKPSPAATEASRGANAAADAQLHPLSGLIGQQVLVAPVQSLRVAPELGWSPPGTQDVLRGMDAEITAAMTERLNGRTWVFADSLEQSYKRNAAYATDPRLLSVELLKAPRLEIGARLPEPLASQVRTMIALFDARVVLIPVELRIERTETGAGRAVVKLVLVDGRSSDIRWSGEATGAPTASFGPALSASLASRIADLIGAP